MTDWLIMIVLLSRVARTILFNTTIIHWWPGKGIVFFIVTVGLIVNGIFLITRRSTLYMIFEDEVMTLAKKFEFDFTTKSNLLVYCVLLWTHFSIDV